MIEIARRGNSQRNSQRRRQAAAALFAAAACAAGYAGHAQAADTTYSWVGPATGGNASWVVGANWQGGVAPPFAPAVQGDHNILVFGGNLNSGTSAQSSTTSSAAGDFDVYGLVFHDYTVPAGVGTFVLNTTGTGSRILKLGAGGIYDDSIGGGTNNGSVTFNASNGSDRRIVLTDNQTWTVANAASTNNLILKRVIDDRLTPADTTSYTITKDGAGTLQLSGANVWTGGMRIANGTVRIDTVQTGQFGTGTLWIDTANSTAISASGSATSTSPFSQTLTNPIEFGGGGTFQLRGSWDIAFNGTIDFAGDKTWSVNAPGGGTFNGSAVPAGIHTVNANITGAGNFTKSGGGTLIVNGDNSGFSGNLAVINGVLSVATFGQLGSAATPVTLGDAVAGAGTTVINAGGLLIRTADQSTGRGITLANGGGNLDFAGNLSINNAITGTGPLTKVGAGNLNINAIRTDGVLTSTTGTTKIAAGGGSAGTSIVGGLVLGGGTGAWTSALDITDHGFVVNYGATDPSPIATIADQIKSGRNGGAWNGNGINSSVAAGSASLAIGYAESSQAVGAGGGTFAGQSVDDSAVLTRTTFAGDGNLDGTVDLTDFTFLAANFNKSGGAQWIEGDYNYDGNVDLTDFTFLASNFNKSLPAGGGSPGTLVPEPTSFLSALVLGASVVGGRRRRRGI